MIVYYLEGIALRARDTEMNESHKVSAFKKVIIYWMDIEYIHMYRYIHVVYININAYIYMYVYSCTK